MKKIVFLFAGFLIANSSVFSQTEAETAIKEALDAVKSQKWSSASTALQTAIVEINNKIAEELGKALPAPLKGWTEESSNAMNQAGLAMLGGGTGAEKTYTISTSKSEDDLNTTSTVKISIVVNSPMMATMVMMINNPMMAGSMGKSVKIGGEKGFEKFEPENNSHEITLVVGNNAVVTISGSDVKDKTIVTAYAQAIDFKKIKATLAE